MTHVAIVRDANEWLAVRFDDDGAASITAKTRIGGACIHANPLDPQAPAYMAGVGAELGLQNVRYVANQGWVGNR